MGPRVTAVSYRDHSPGCGLWWVPGPHHEASLAPMGGCSPEHGLHVDDGLGVRHVVLLGAHGALLVHHHQVVRIDDAALQQAVQAVQGQQYGRRISPGPQHPFPLVGPTAHLRQSGEGGRGDSRHCGRAVPSLLVHRSLHVIDHGETADGLQEVVVGPVGTAGPGGAICSMAYPLHTVGAPQTPG